MPNRARGPSLLLLLAIATPAAAESVPPPGGIPDFVAARTLGMSAEIGAPAGNEGIYVNPAAMAARKGYSVEGEFLLDRRGADTVDRYYGASVVDSQTSALTAGASYLREDGAAYSGNIFHIALAGALAQGFNIGLTGKLFSLEGATSYLAMNVDAGAWWQLADIFSLGFVGYNLVPGGNPLVAPRAIGAGFALGTDRVFQVTGDWREDFDRNGGKTTNRYSAGAEALLGKLIPVRAGFIRDEILGTNWWSAGAGFVTGSAALDLGYRQSLSDRSARTLAATFKIFI